MKIKMKTPLTYYGGKARLCSKILDLIPAHKRYCEPFVGGGAVFFGKQPSETEILNDTNHELINFYRVVQNRFIELDRLVRVTLHSRRSHDDASTIYNRPHLFNEVERAWALWVLAMQSFSSVLDGTWGYDKNSNTTTKKINNKREQFSEEFAARLQNVQLECADALYVIQSRDTDDTLFYCDPPYFNSNCGHYDGYTKEDFEGLLRVLSAISGRFIMSSYPSDLLQEYALKNGWKCHSIEQGVSVNKGFSGKKKVEVLTTNF